MSHILVTGANGFVGQAVCARLLAGGHRVTGLVRRPDAGLAGTTPWVFAGADYAGLDEAWPPALQADVVIHLAARVHVMHDEAPDPDAAFHATNVEGTLRVARAARAQGARRFVFVSSVKALAERDAGRPLRETDTPHPEDAYGRSKLAAEQALIEFGKASGLEIAIVRPPLVYGPQVRANFLQMMNAVSRGVPLPFGAVTARRSLVYVGNLADALACVATDARAAGQCFHVADDVAPTVPELLTRLGAQLNRPARLPRVPVAWLQLAGRLTGRGAQIERLTNSLTLDTTRLRTTLDWSAPYSLDQGLADTARWFLSTRKPT